MRSTPPPEVRVVVSPLFEENAYLLALPERDDCLVVDPGLDPASIEAEIDRWGKTPSAILNTHGHADHIAGNARLKERWPDAPLIIGEGDSPKLGDPKGNLSAGYGLALVSPPADRTVREGDVLELAGMRLLVRETPGHSAGHVAYFALDYEPELVLGGDVLFAGSIGRSDFPDSDPEALVASIRLKFYALPDRAVVLTGHGPTTTIGRERRSNPFVRD
jgi:glyoxylase-like metal-dependent hydrolase (beta-lactamase superfamily II)